MAGRFSPFARALPEFNPASSVLGRNLPPAFYVPLKPPLEDLHEFFPENEE
jgi:hypothetical protein